MGKNLGLDTGSAGIVGVVVYPHNPYGSPLYTTTYSTNGNKTFSFTATTDQARIKIYRYASNGLPIYFYLDNITIKGPKIITDTVKMRNVYRYAFNGIEKADEIAGAGNHYTAVFGEYDSRLGRRWNQDPKPNTSISNYAVFGNNPIWFSDPFFDSIKSTQEGFNILNEGLTATLGKDHGFSYDNDKGIMNFKALEGKTYTADQQEVICRIQTLIESDKNTNVNIVNHDEKIGILGKSLADFGFNGVTATPADFSSFNVFIARNPKEYGMIANPKYNPLRPDGQTEEIPGYVNTSLIFRGVSVIHEVGGHSYLKLTLPTLTQPTHNTLVESFETTFRQFYQIGIYDSKRDVKRANKNGLGVNLGDPKFLGGTADKH